MRRSAILLLVLFLQAAAAAEPRTYAVLSLVSDKLTVARFQPAIGSRLDTNVKKLVELPGRDLDRIMAFAVDDAIRKADPAAKVVPLIANDAAIYAAQSSTAETGAQAVLPALRDMLAAARATHLVLVTKFRGEARIPIRASIVGSGWLEGLGFYLDDALPLTDLEKREDSQGLLAPFGYVRFSLVDLAGARVLREAASMRAVAVANQKAASTWENLTGPQKARMLQEIIREQAAEAVPKLLAP